MLLVVKCFNLLFFQDLPPGQNVSNQRTVARSRSAGPDTISNSGKPGASRMKTINRFSNFVKSGMESYILTQSKMTTQPGETHEVIVSFLKQILSFSLRIVLDKRWKSYVGTFKS